MVNELSNAQVQFPSSKEVIFSLPLDQIHPRKINAYAITDIERLAESIQRSGLLQPVIVKKESDESYQLIAGERRYTAVRYLRDRYQQAGDQTKASLFDTIQAIVYESLPEDKEDQIYRDTNDYSRQMNTFQRIAVLNPEKINMKDPYWQEEFVRHVYGEVKVISWQAGFVMVRGTQRERSKLVHALLLEQNPDSDVSEKTIRNYLAFLDRCNEDLRLATLMGKISIRDAMAISWNSSNEQTDAVNSIGKEIYKDYVEEGRRLSGSDDRKAARKNKPVSAELRSYQKKFSKLGEEYKKTLTNLDDQSELTKEDTIMIAKLKQIVEAIESLDEMTTQQ